MWKKLKGRRKHGSPWQGKKAVGQSPIKGGGGLAYSQKEINMGNAELPSKVKSIFHAISAETFWFKVFLSNIMMAALPCWTPSSRPLGL
jgi:hypothetical protein